VPVNPHLIFRPSEAVLGSKVNACGMVSLSFSVCARRFCSLFIVFCLKHAVSKSSPLAEQLWNIANQMMTTEVAPDEKKNTTYFIAGYLKDAHDFALLSEEEAGTMLTKGHLARERFHGEAYASSYIDFSSDKLNATDLCSEFSAQGLLSSVANAVDGISIDTSSNKLDPQDSPETSQLLG